MAFTSETAREAGKKSTRAGKLNKTTKEIKEAYQRLLSGNLDNMAKWLNQIGKDNPEKAFNLILKLSDFIVPRLSRQEINMEKKPISEMTEEERDVKLRELASILQKRLSKNEKNGKAK